MRPTLRIAFAIGIATAAVAVVPVGGATRGFTVSPDIVHPGERVIVRIDDSGPWHGTDLYLIPSSAWFEGMHCDGMRAAILVGIITWTDHLGVSEFVVPSVSNGTYALGEELGAVVPPCDQAGAITVSTSRGPDTAMHREESWWAPPLIGAGLFVLLAAGVVTVRRRIPT